MNNKKLIIAAYIFEIALIIILSFMYYLNQSVKTPNVLYIPKGSINKIISHLHSEKYNVSKLDTLLLRFIGSPQSGWINMGTQNLTRAEFLYRLTHAKAALQNVTLIPGETTVVFLDLLAKQLDLNYGLLFKEFNAKSNYPEGVFVPNTYSLPLGITEEHLIELLLKQSRAQMKKLSYKIFGDYNEKKWFQYVAIASVIQKESASKEEMPLISSVIYNRIRKGMKLQMDGTLNYGIYSHQRVTAKRIREDNSTFNTYKHAGIPKFPVCNVSLDAITAAIFPAKTDYLYFVKTNSGKHTFSCNYSTHLYNIRHVTKRNKMKK